jgi:hypothetical protein
LIRAGGDQGFLILGGDSMVCGRRISPPKFQPLFPGETARVETKAEKPGFNSSGFSWI